MTTQDIVEVLRAAASDPMWADHCELNKRYCTIAADEIERLRPNWRPISEIPKDHTTVLAVTADGRMMIWAVKILRTALDPKTPDHLRFPATHWMSLPEGPPRHDK